jgi:hypothetical protein
MHLQGWGSCGSYGAGRGLREGLCFGLCLPDDPKSKSFQQWKLACVCSPAVLEQDKLDVYIDAAKRLYKELVT